MKARVIVLFLSFQFQICLFGFEDTKLPFACKDDDIAWAGMTCSDTDPCPVYLEFTSIAASGSRIFIAGNIHSAQTTLYSLFLRSDDGGATWQEPMGRVRGDLLDHIQFANFESGWVSGQRAVPLAGDPFLMATRDGGKSWRKEQFLPEGTPGFIQKFRFDGATSGRLMLDRGVDEADEPRYRLYETRDGGETWSQSEAAGTPLKNAPAPQDDAVWRLRSDATGKTMIVEHRTADKWTAAARFAIQIALCQGQ